MAEGLLRHLLVARGISARVDSGGLMHGGVAATPVAVEVLAERGIDIAGHRSRSLAEVDLEGADLVITMERRHLQEAILLAPPIRSRTFTLRELVRRAEAVGPRRPEETLAEWATRLTVGRTNAELVGHGDGVDDPMGRSRSRYVETADLLTDLLGRTVDLAWPGTTAGAGAA